MTGHEPRPRGRGPRRGRTFRTGAPHPPRARVRASSRAELPPGCWASFHVARGARVHRRRSSLPRAHGDTAQRDTFHDPGSRRPAWTPRSPRRAPRDSGPPHGRSGVRSARPRGRSGGSLREGPSRCPTRGASLFTPVEWSCVSENKVTSVRGRVPRHSDRVPRGAVATRPTLAGAGAAPGGPGSVPEQQAARCGLPVPGGPVLRGGPSAVAEGPRPRPAARVVRRRPARTPAGPA